jgi:AcrR family transcriptional regulator
MSSNVEALGHHGQISLPSGLLTPVCMAYCPPSPLEYEQMLTNKTGIRDGRGRRRKKTLRARKVPTQVRSQETVIVILEASARILESHGLHAFNTNAIAARAGVSIGSPYQYFPNKDAILLALIGRFEEALHDAVLNTMQGGRGQELKPRLRLLVRALVMAHYDRPRLNRVLEAEEERLGSGADSAAFHASVLQLLQEHKTKWQCVSRQQRSGPSLRFSAL